MEHVQPKSASTFAPLTADGSAPSLAELLAEAVDYATAELESLEARRTALETAAREARDGTLTSEVVAQIREAVAQVQAIAAEIDVRAEAGTMIVADADAAIAELDVDAEGDADADPLAAGGAPARTRPVVTPPRRHQPRATPPPSPTVLVASGGGAGNRFTTDRHTYASLDDATEAIFDQAERVRGRGADGELLPVVSLSWAEQIGEERRFTGQSSAADNSVQLDRIVDAHRENIERQIAEVDGGLPALVAAGGIPGPAEPRYSQLVFGQADRPLRDALPQVGLTRGTIAYNESPILGDIVLDTALGAIGTVSAATDLAGSYTKNVQSISAPTPLTATVEANTLRFEHGNFADRFNPERRTAFTELGLTAYARHNDALRLTDLKTGSTKWTDTPAKFSAYRDWAAQLIGVVEELRDRMRDQDVPLVAFMPGYTPGMFATDMLRQQPGDESWMTDPGQMRAHMLAFAASQGVILTFLRDSIRGRMLSTPSGQSPRTPGFDADVEWCLFPEGTWVFGDGGELDLGIVRDSTLNAANKFQTFYESWECVFRVVPSSLSIWITSSLCAGGVTQIAKDVAVCSPQGS